MKIEVTYGPGYVVRVRETDLQGVVTHAGRDDDGPCYLVRISTGTGLEHHWLRDSDLELLRVRVRKED